MIATVVSVLTFLPLLVIAFAHLLWALGTNWPISSEALLAQTVIGRTGVTHMPNRLLTLFVAIVLFAVAVIAMGLSGHDDGGRIRTGLGVVCAIVFLGRGALGYTPGWRARFAAEPFATLDRRNYSPLSLWIGAGFLILVALRLT